MSKIQIGVIGYRDPEDRYRIIKSVPIMAEEIEEMKVSEEEMLNDAAKVFADKFKQYKKGNK